MRPGALRKGLPAAAAAALAFELVGVCVLQDHETEERSVSQR